VLLISVMAVTMAARRASAAREQAVADARESRIASERAEAALAEVGAAKRREEQAAGTALGALGTAAQERKKAEGLLSLIAEERKKTEVLQAAIAEDRRKVDALQASIAKHEQANTELAKQVRTDKPEYFLPQRTTSNTLSCFSPDSSRIVGSGLSANGRSADKVNDARTGEQIF